MIAEGPDLAFAAPWPKRSAASSPREADKPMGWPTYDKPPVAAFIDVDGTLLAQTTTFLFARILRRKGLLRRSFVLRAVYHGLQHRFGRLDYGRLVNYGLKCISNIPVVELERIAYDNFAEFVKPRLFEGVVDHFTNLRKSGTSLVLVSSSPGLVIEPLSIFLGCAATLTTPVLIQRGRLVGIGSRPAMLWRRQAVLRGAMGGRTRIPDGRIGRVCG